MTKLRALLGRVARASKNEKGQSLLEIVGFLVLVGILITVFATRILGAQDSAQDKTSHETLKRAIIAAETVYGASNSTYPAGMAADAPTTCSTAAGDSILECVDSALDIFTATAGVNAAAPTAANMTALAGAPNTLRVEAGNATNQPVNQEIVIQTVSRTGRVWCVRLNAATYVIGTTTFRPGTFYGGGMQYTDGTAITGCNAAHTTTASTITGTSF